MVRLQKIVRANGSVIYTIVIPKEVVDTIGYEKGQELNIEIKGKSQILEVRMC